MKIVEAKAFAGANPVRCAISCVGREVLHPLGKRRSAAKAGEERYLYTAFCGYARVRFIGAPC